MLIMCFVLRIWPPGIWDQPCNNVINIDKQLTIVVNTYWSLEWFGQSAWATMNVGLWSNAAVPNSSSWSRKETTRSCGRRLRTGKSAWRWHMGTCEETGAASRCVKLLVKLFLLKKRLDGNQWANAATRLCIRLGCTSPSSANTQLQWSKCFHVLSIAIPMDQLLSAWGLVLRARLGHLPCGYGKAMYLLGFQRAEHPIQVASEGDVMWFLRKVSTTVHRFRTPPHSGIDMTVSDILLLLRRIRVHVKICQNHVNPGFLSPLVVRLGSTVPCHHFSGHQSTKRI